MDEDFKFQDDNGMHLVHKKLNLLFRLMSFLHISYSLSCFFQSTLICSILFHLCDSVSVLLGLQM